MSRTIPGNDDYVNVTMTFDQWCTLFKTVQWGSQYDYCGSNDRDNFMQAVVDGACQQGHDRDEVETFIANY